MALDLGGEVREPVRDRLEAADRPAELLALLDVREHFLERALRHPERLRRDDQPLVVEPGHQLHPGLVGGGRRPAPRARSSR